MPHGCETETRRRRRPTRSALSAALLSLFAVLSLLILAGLPATADAEIRPTWPCAAKVRDPACPAQRFAVQVSIEADEPAGESRTLAPRASTRAVAHRAPLFMPHADPVPPSAAARLPERPPRQA